MCILVVTKYKITIYILLLVEDHLLLNIFQFDRSNRSWQIKAIVSLGGGGNIENGCNKRVH